MGVIGDLVRAMSNRERVIGLAGLLAIGAFLSAYLVYTMIGPLRAVEIFGESGPAWHPERDGSGPRLDLLGRLVSRPLILGALAGAAALVWSLRRTPLFDGVRAFGRANAGLPLAVLGTLCGLVIAGHAMGRPRSLFPFPRWGMYSGAYQPSVIFSYDPYGVTAGGERILINVARTIPSTHRGAPRRFTETSEPVARGAASPEEARLLDDIAVSVARLHGSLHHTVYVAVEVVETQLHRVNPGRFRRASRLIRTIPLPADGPGPRRPGATE